MAGAPSPTYRLAATVDVDLPQRGALHWLTDPDALQRWVVGLRSAAWAAGGGAAPGAEVQVTSGTNRFVNAYVGTIVELTDTLLVKRYVLAQRRLTSELQYERIVRYGLARAALGTRLTCDADVTVVGLPRAAVRRSASVEQRSLDRSLDRLRVLAAGHRIGWFRRCRDGNLSAQVL